MSEPTEPTHETVGRTPRPRRRPTSTEPDVAAPPAPVVQKTAGPPPPAHLVRNHPLIFEVLGPNRSGLVEEIIETLRGFRPEVVAWMVRFDAEGETPDPELYTTDIRVGPIYWRARVEAEPLEGDAIEPARARRAVGDAFFLEISCPNCPLDGHGNPIRTGWTVTTDRDFNGADIPTALVVTPTGAPTDAASAREPHVDENDVRWLSDVIAREMTGQTPLSREQALLSSLVSGIEAMRLTREYIDPTGGALHALPGWSWFDWVNAAQDLVRDLGYTIEEWRPVHAPPVHQAHVPSPTSPPAGTPPVGPRTGEVAAVAPLSDGPADGAEIWDRHRHGVDETVISKADDTRAHAGPARRPRRRLGDIFRGGFQDPPPIPGAPGARPAARPDDRRLD